MHLNENIQVWGCITQEKYIMGRSAAELERILGFHNGRLRQGFVVAALDQVPAANEFEFLGYTQVAEHRHDASATKNLDINKLKEMVRRDVFAVSGINRLVKVLANIPHQLSMSNDDQYPPGLGVPQWKLTRSVGARIIQIQN